MKQTLPTQDDMQAINALAARHEGAWQRGYDRFPAVLNRLGLTRGVEVGVAFGGHSEAILKQTAVQELVGVDSYQHRAGYDDPMNLPQPQFDALHQRTSDRLTPYAQRFSLVREESAQAAERFGDEQLCFVYLDADHSEQGVWRDLCAWAPKVRVGGIIAGHDYGHRDFPGVQRAVDRFVGRFGWTVHEEGEGVWWAQRTALPISYFIPCYNCEPWLEQSVASILKGNLEQGDELILVNDGSSDATPEMIERIAASHPAVRAIHHDKNRGGSAARNSAVDAAKHALCFCLDSDNLVEPGSVAPLRGHLLRTGVDAVGFQELRYFTDEGGPDNITHTLVYEDVITDFSRYLATKLVPGASGNYLFTRQSWQRAGGYPEQAGALDAWGFGLRQAATGSTMTVLPGTYYLHRHSHDSYWVRHDRAGTIDAAALDVLRPYFDQLDPRDVRYLQSDQGERTWFAQLNKRPIRLKTTQNKAKTVTVVTKIRNRLRRFAQRAA
ncbi:MAG: glycosyltransferase [Phycisphaerales bacterium JB063]